MASTLLRLKRPLRIFLLVTELLPGYNRTSALKVSSEVPFNTQKTAAKLLQQKMKLKIYRIVFVPSQTLLGHVFTTVHGLQKISLLLCSSLSLWMTITLCFHILMSPAPHFPIVSCIALAFKKCLSEIKQMLVILLSSLSVGG